MSFKITLIDASSHVNVPAGKTIRKVVSHSGGRTSFSGHFDSNGNSDSLRPGQRLETIRGN